MAASISGSASLVRYLLDRGARLEVAIAHLPTESTAQSLPKCSIAFAAWMGHIDIVTVLLNAGAVVPPNVDAWLWKGVFWVEGLENRIERRMASDKTIGAHPIGFPMHKLPTKESLSSVASRMVVLLKQNLKSKEATKPLDEKQFEALQHAWGNRITASQVAYLTPQFDQQSRQFTASLKQHWKLNVRYSFLL
jgi:hypothetical protein